MRSEDVAANGCRADGCAPAPGREAAWNPVRPATEAVALEQLAARAAVGSSPLAASEVAVWRLFRPMSLPVPACCLAVLDGTEREQAARFLRPDDSRRYALAHGLMRLVLAAHTGRQPEAVAFVRSPLGKPRLDPDGPACNLSHAGDCILVAVCAGAAVGVDVEPLQPLPDADALVERFFAAEERLAYRAVPEAARLAAFFAAWTRKEAYVKALGGGLSIPLADFAVSLDAPARLVRPFAAAPAPGPQLTDIPVPPGYAGALAGRADRLAFRDILV